MTGAIIVAAGKGTRMGTDQKKPFLDLMGMPVLARTLSAFEQAPSVHGIAVVVHPGDEAYCRERIIGHFGFSKVMRVVPGGEDRQDSVRAGVDALDPDMNVLVIHDGARPLVSVELIEKTIRACYEEIQYKGHGSVCAAVPVKDTVRIARPQQKPDGPVYSGSTLDRSLLWVVQTPQVFDRDLLMRAHAQAALQGYSGTDDTVLAERLGILARLVPGEYANIKITTPEDLLLAGLLLRNSIKEPERGKADDKA